MLQLCRIDFVRYWGFAHWETWSIRPELSYEIHSEIVNEGIVD